jgi:hypothetical protein
VLPYNPRYRMETMGTGELAFPIAMGVSGAVPMPLASTGESTG